MKFRYLTFDCYGTLIDWRSGIESSLRREVGKLRLAGQDLIRAYVEAEKGQESGYKKYRKVLSDTARSMSPQLGVEVTSGAAERFAGSVPLWPAFKDTGGFLREVGKRGYKRYILSNVDDDLLEGTIRNNRLDVDGFVTAEQVGSYKPKPGHWLRFMEETGARKEEVLHVAQSLFHDIAPTQEMGIASAWVNRYSEGLPAGLAPLYISDSLKRLGDILE